MSFSDAVSLGADLFRISYEAIDAVAHQKPIQPNTQLSLQDVLTQVVHERFEQVTKNHLALIDAFFSIGSFANPRFECFALPYRIATIARGLYLVKTDPNADLSSIRLESTLQLLNISRLAATLLDSKVSLLFKLGDTAIRVYTITSNRFMIADQIKDSWRRSDSSTVFAGVKRLVIELPNYALRTAFATALIFTNLSFIQKIVNTIYGISINSIGEIGVCILLTGGLAYSLDKTIQQTFDGVNTQKSTQRRATEIAVAVISAATLVAASAVGLGRATSLSAILMPLYPLAFITGVSFTTTMLFKDIISKGIHKICDQFNIEQKGYQREFLAQVIGPAVTIISSIALAIFASKQMGILVGGFEQPLVQVLAPLTIAMICVNFFRLAARTFAFGAPEWTEMFHSKF